MEIKTSHFNVVDMLQSIVGYKGLPFPAGWFSQKIPGGYTGEDFEVLPKDEPWNMLAGSGTALYKEDALGNYYFMPVTFIHKGTEYEMDCALISITGKKNIIETQLVGRKGSVKELINLDDYEINITGAVIGDNQRWPEDKINAIKNLYNINEAIELKCALTALFMEQDDKVVITNISLPAAAQSEHVQVFEIRCKTDRAFELIME